MLIGNSNTNKVHSPGCRAIGMMKQEHMITTEDGEGYDSCGWCHAQGSIRTPTQSHLKLTESDPIGTKICNDPYFINLFTLSGCLGCKGHEGTVKMFQDPQGATVKGEKGHWWIYLECDHCGYQTAWWKAEQRLTQLKRFRTELKAKI